MIELIFVIAILAVLALVLVPNISKFVNKSEVSRDQSNAKALYNAAVMAAADPLVEGEDAIKAEALELANIKSEDADKVVIDYDEETNTVISVTFGDQTFDGTDFNGSDSE